MAQDDRPSNSIGNITNNQGIITQGQTGNNTINVGSVKLAFDQAIADELASKLPTGKPVSLIGIGSDSDQAIAYKYLEFLQTKGFQVQWGRAGMVISPPDQKITILNAPNAVVIRIAPSAN